MVRPSLQKVYDQDSLMVISENGGDLILNKEFQKFKDLINLSLWVCRKADPESKGSIENLVGYIRHNFAKHRLFQILIRGMSKIGYGLIGQTIITA